MSVPSINGASRVPTATADALAPTPTAVTRQGSDQPVVEIDEVTQQPRPSRFPWLSRVSRELESAAQQRPSFPDAPVLGDHVDRSA